MPVIPGLGDRLREARRKNGLSLEELAEKAGTNRRSLYSYEKGLVDPRVGDLLEIGKILNVTVGYFVGEDRAVLPEAMQDQLRALVRQELESLRLEDQSKLIRKRKS